MMMTTVSLHTIGRTAIAIGGVTLAGVVSIMLFFTVGGVFGSLNDLCNAVEAILSAGLASALHRLYRPHSPRLSRFMLIAASAGALIATIGSILVIFEVTGWFLAALVSTFGFALIGLWLLGLSYVSARVGTWPRPLIQLGLVAGSIMTIGLLAGLGIPGRIDDPGSAAWFVQAGLLSWLGTYLLYPAWCIWLGRRLLSNRLDMHVAANA